MEIVIVVLVVLCGILSYIVYNLLVKVEKYEQITLDQVEYLQNIAKTIAISKEHLKTLDENGVFESDDELGAFFKNMQAVQDELNRYMLPENYGQEKIQS
jgi:cell division protein FtsB